MDEETGDGVPYQLPPWLAEECLQSRMRNNNQTEEHERATKRRGNRVFLALSSASISVYSLVSSDIIQNSKSKC